MAANKYGILWYLARLASFVVLIVCIAFIFLVMWHLSPVVSSDYSAVDGVLDLSGFDATGDRPIRVVGYWERYRNYDNFFHDEVDFSDYSHLRELVRVPMYLNADTHAYSVYRLRIISDLPNVYVSMSPIKSHHTIFINGVPVYGTDIDSEVMLISLFDITAFRLDFDANREYQEVLILISGSYEGVDFFQSEFIIGRDETLRLHILRRLGTWALITGLMIMLLVNRLIFMAMCPENKTASLMTMIDIAVFVRLMLGIPDLYHVKIILLGFNISNANVARLNFLPVLIIGMLTILFVARIFNAENHVNKKWFHAVAALFGLVGIVYFFNTYLIAYNLGFSVFLAFFIPGCIVGGLTFYRHLREQLRNKQPLLTKVQMLYVFSLMVIGIVIWFDMTTMRMPHNHFVILLVGYFLIICSHLLASLWENFISYRELKDVTIEREKLENLLQTVNLAAMKLLTAEDKEFEPALMQSMELIGYHLNVDRVQLWRVTAADKNKTLNVVRINQWQSEVGENLPQKETALTISYGELPHWELMILNGEEFNGPISHLPKEEQIFLESQGAPKSVVLIPIFLHDEIWGIFNIDDCVNEATLSEEEMDIMRSASLMMASSFHRVELQKERQRIEVAEESNKAKSRFLARMSHEIRTPITTVLGVSDIQLQTPNLTTEVEDAFGRINTSANTLLNIVNDILDLSKIEAGKMELLHEEYDVASLISDGMHMCPWHVGNGDVKFVVQVDENLPSCLIGDVLRIQQVMSNLISNAFKYTEEGEVGLSLLCNRNDQSDVVELIITIRDTGLGMSPEQLNTLKNSEYTRFHEQENKHISGTGLGIPIIQNLLQLMDGNIEMESGVGKGTIAIITIPQRLVKGKETQVLGKTAATRLQQFEDITSSRSKKFVAEPMPYGSVLIVDDVASNIFVAEGLLSFYEIKTDSCNSGYEAIEKIKQGNVYDIIFMDSMMPNMNGTETLHALRAIGYTQPIVALTANALIGQAEKFIRNGFDGFISKPIQTKQLNAILNKYIRDKYPPQIREAKKGNILEKIDSYQTELVEKLKQDFAKTRKNTVKEIREALDNNDINTAHRLAHTLKGSASLIHEQTLSKASQQMEHMLSENKKPTQEELAALENELNNVLKTIKPPEETGTIKTTYDKTAAIALLNKLDPILSSRNVDCMNFIDELNKIPEAAILVRQMENFDYTTAIESLKTLIELYE